MKRIIYLFFLFWIFSFSKSQNNPFSVSCAFDDFQQNVVEELALLGNCGNTSPYYNNYNLYLPQSNDDIIYVKLNFIFLTKPDGTGNFEQNNPEHIQVINDVVSRVNQTLLNLEGQPTSSCEGYGQTNQTNTKLQFVVNKIWRADPAWDYLYTGYDPDLPGEVNNPQNYMLWPWDLNRYYYSYLDDDPTIPSGINVVFANNGSIYNELINQNYTMGPGEGWAASQYPSKTNLSQKLRQFFPNIYNKYLWMKNYVADNPDPASPSPNTPWSTVYSWYATNLRKGIIHETGHNFYLDHHNSCYPNIMNQTGTAPGNYLSNRQISTMYLSASTSSVRQYFTENSFKNTNIDITNSQTFDLNFRLYSNVKIDNNSSLKATCKIIMAPQSRFIVKDGSNFIMEGAEINSANASLWNGIKVEGNGYFLINPDTYIEGNYFYAYADNTPLPNTKSTSQSGKSDLPVQTEAETEIYRIYPNPTGDFINIDTKKSITKIEVYNLAGKNFKANFMNKKVDVRNLPAGNYVLRIHSFNDVKVVHFIKQNN